MAEFGLTGCPSGYCDKAGLRTRLESLVTLVAHSSVGSGGYDVSFGANLDAEFCHRRLNDPASMLGCAECL